MEWTKPRLPDERHLGDHHHVSKKRLKFAEKKNCEHVDCKNFHSLPSIYPLSLKE